MRILYLSGAAIPSTSANSVQVMKMCQALAANGHEARLVARAGSLQTRDSHAFYGVAPSFTLELIPRYRAWSGLRFALGAARVARQVGGLDLIYARHLPSLALAANTGIPFVVEMHAVPSPLQRVLFMSLLRRPGLTRVISISRALSAELSARFPTLPSQRWVVVPDAADPPEEPETPVDFGTGEPALRVGYVGHLYPGKGMEVIAAIAPRMQDVEFHVVGGREREVAFWRRRVEGTPNIFLHGFVLPAEADAFRLGVDVLVAPYQERVGQAGGSRDISKWMSPLKIFEYMAARKPIIASDLPVLREVLTDDENALLVDAGDTDAWIAAIQRLKNGELRRRLAEAAYADFERCYTWRQRARLALADLPAVRHA
jgi:glycosyltransferase involved in cell wall biosynthesis